jgi:hypothetical protein
MDVDAKSESSESEDEVRACCIPWSQQLCSNNFIPRRRSFTPQVHWNSWKRAGA